MNLLNFIVWMIAGAIVGWFASRMVQMEKGHRYKPIKVDE